MPYCTVMCNRATLNQAMHAQHALAVFFPSCECASEAGSAAPKELKRCGEYRHEARRVPCSCVWCAAVELPTAAPCGGSPYSPGKLSRAVLQHTNGLVATSVAATSRRAECNTLQLGAGHTSQVGALCSSVAGGGQQVRATFESAGLQRPP